ncbi:hypothetical protein QE152_g17088 [Popillia japonica]|uniref:Uncharacterized protein n=1 Tax=Popillia japonica TaxID=7064 RepID=A0AAW1L469_POPJA
MGTAHNRFVQKAGILPVFLGCMLDARLSWGPHITDLCKKLGFFQYALRTLTQNVNRESMLMFYRACIESRIRFGLIASRIRFGLIAWGGSSHVNRESMLMFYRACIESRIRFGLIAWGGSSQEP